MYRTYVRVYDRVNIDSVINVMKEHTWMTAAEASKALGINRSTLYAYVSRGFIRSEARAGKTRERRYSREDVERLKRRNEERRDPEKAASHALQWGLPILESAITLIANGKLYYRGHDATELARTRSIEEVASLIWSGAFETNVADTQLHVVSGARAVDHLPFISRAQSVVALVGARDALAYDVRPHAVAQCGWRIINLLASVAAETPDLADTIEETLAQAWAPKTKQAATLIRAALILCADHELNVSSFTARCVASAGSNPYNVVLAGLAAMEGSKHGGVTVRVEERLSSLRRKRGSVRDALAERLRRGETLDGFGHPLYPQGDPRATTIFDLMRDHFRKSPELAFAAEVAQAGIELLGERPTVDFALVALARVLRLPPAAPLTLFAIGRTIGWIGHAIEQYGRNEIIRPRARYTGEMP
jgi:citrate synthase